MNASKRSECPGFGGERANGVGILRDGDLDHALKRIRQKKAAKAVSLTKYMGRTVTIGKAKRKRSSRPGCASG